MASLSGRVEHLQESAIRKLDYTVRAQQDVVFSKINIGQPDVPTPAPLLKALNNWRPKVVAYGPASGLPECREAVAAYYQRWCPGLGAMNVSITVGGSEALLFAFTAICDPGDEILVPEPFYTNYNGFATVASAKIKPLRTHMANGFALPSDAELDAACTDRTKAIVFSNPCNPTGAVYDRASLKRLLAWAKRRDIWVIADEVYRRIWFSEEAPASCLEFEAYKDRVVVVDSMSKTWSACGLRVGFLITRSDALMEKVERLGQARLGVQPLSQVGAIAALALDEGYYDDIRATYRERVQTMMQALCAIDGVSAPTPQGAFYSMVELPIDDCDRFAKWLVTDFRHEGKSVVVAPGAGFYADPSSGRNQIRVAAVSETAVLLDAVDMLRRALLVYPGRTN